ncbi:nuclear transport factor 2 family protein [Embleya sp. NPDC127516]|uniref:nuclear transport factor 2 family protein n=1 Tax=Embleya sp. NPDC127516 TaxID=3363990 RepID=UPI0037F97C8F
MDSVVRAAVEAQDRAALEDLLADDVRLYSPVKFKPFEGRAMVLGLLDVLLRTFEDFRCVGRFEGSTDTDSGGTDAAAEILVFRAAVRGTRIHGIDLLRCDETGRIEEITVMVRPQSAVLALGEAVLAGLVADGLVPGPVDR